jgi:hypothetical protein
LFRDNIRLKQVKKLATCIAKVKTDRSGEFEEADCLAV